MNPEKSSEAGVSESSMARAKAIYAFLTALTWSGLALGAPVYKYVLVLNHKSDLCQHMGDVFNRDFAHLWDSAPDQLNQPDAAPSSLPTPFPPLPGVEQAKQFASTVRYSRYPSSREFDAVPWRLGQIQLGTKLDGPPNFQPMLIAHFDFDNDGYIDTVTKLGFPRGYGELTMPRDTGNTEYISVWRSQADADVNPDSTTLEKESPDDRSALVTGGYIRPFIYKGRTYVARYGLRKKVVGVPEREWMLIDEFSYEGSLDPISPAFKRPALHERVLCRFQMTDLGKRR